MTEKDNDEMTVCSADQHCLIVSPSSSIWLYPFSISYVIFGLKILWSKGCCGAVCAWSCLVSSWVTSYRYCGNTMMIKIIIPTWNSQGIPQPQWPDKGERAVIGTGNRGGCNAKKFEKARARIHGARSNDSSPQKVRRAYVKDEKPVALMFLMQKGCQTTPPCPTSPHRKVVFASLRHPCRCLLRAQVCGQAGVALWLCKGHKVLLQLFTFLLLCFVFLLIHRPASCNCLSLLGKERRSPVLQLILLGTRGIFAWICWILDDFQQQSEEKTKKTTKPPAPHCPSYRSSFPSCSSPQDGCRGVSLCFLILVYCPLSALPSSACEDFSAATIPQWQPANSPRPSPSLWQLSAGCTLSAWQN